MEKTVLFILMFYFQKYPTNLYEIWNWGTVLESCWAILILVLLGSVLATVYIELYHFSNTVLLIVQKINMHTALRFTVKHFSKSYTRMFICIDSASISAVK